MSVKRSLLQLTFACTLCLLIQEAFVSADQIFPAHTGGTLGRGSREPKYKTEFHPEDSPYHPDDEQESVFMPNTNGRDFLCYLPKVEKPKSGRPSIQQNTSSMIMESEKRLKVKTPDELLEVLEERCFLRQEGWWSYEFCYHQNLRQFHLEDDKVVQEFILGRYDEEATGAYHENLFDISRLKDPRSKDASQRYHAHQYTNGTLCDLTNKPRETEVRFLCSELRAMISSITELSTCKYALTVHAPMLCKNPLLFLSLAHVFRKFLNSWGAHLLYFSSFTTTCGDLAVYSRKRDPFGMLSTAMRFQETQKK